MRDVTRLRYSIMRISAGNMDRTPSGVEAGADEVSMVVPVKL